MSIKMQNTDRGFGVASFEDCYQSPCSIQESSSASEPRIWLGVDADRMHLNQQMVADLLPLLEYFKEHGTLPEAE